MFNSCSISYMLKTLNIFFKVHWTTVRSNIRYYIWISSEKLFLNGKKIDLNWIDSIIINSLISSLNHNIVVKKYSSVFFTHSIIGCGACIRIIHSIIMNWSSINHLQSVIFKDFFLKWYLCSKIRFKCFINEMNKFDLKRF